MSEYSSQRLKSLFYHDNPIRTMSSFVRVASGFCMILFLSACARQGKGVGPCSETERQSSLALIQESALEPEHKKAALVNVELGLHYLSQEQRSRAKHKLMHAVQLAPNIVEPHSALAYFFEKVGDVKEAEQEHKKALRLGSGKGALANNYGAFLYRQNRYQEASQAFHRALQDKKYEHSAEVNENAGFCAEKLLDFKAAENYFNTAIHQDPNRTRARTALAALKMKKQTQQIQQGGKNI